MAKAAKKRFDSPDEVRTPPNAKVEFVDLGGGTALRGTFQPGWKWSESVKSVVGTDTCEVEHLGYVVSGTMVCKMNDGTEISYNAGDVAYIPPGHDAWVEGSEPCVFLDFQGATNYAVPSKADAAA